VKADGYGLGAILVAAALAGEGARTFFVAHAGEGAALRAGLGSGPTIYVLHGGFGPDISTLIEADLIPVLSAPEQIGVWAETGRAAAIQVETGMNRLGLAPNEAAFAAALLGSRAGLVMSHLACGSAAAEANLWQQARFDALAPLFPNARRSLAASAGALLDGFGYDLIRPGIGLYGGAPLDRDSPSLQTVATLHAPILQIRTLLPGDSVGYGATFTAERPMRAATIALGYADGWLRALSGRGYGFVGGRQAPFLGRVSMDLISLDVTGANVNVGDEVELLGAHVPLDDVAHLAGTISYEVLTSLKGVTKTYVGGHG
jgi:alanine racemase